MISTVLIHSAIAGLVVATGLGFRAVRLQSAGPLQGARILAGVSALLVVTLLVRRGIALEQAPLVSRFDTHLLVALLLIVAAMGLDLLRTLPILTIGALPLALVSLILAAATGEPIDPTAPFAATPMAGIHAVLTLLGYVAFAVAFVMALLFLIEQRQLKAHDPPGALGLMPSLETSYKLTLRSVVAGLVLLTGGILCGYLYAREKFGITPEWRGDAKIIVTSLMWAGFLVVAILSSLPSFKGRKTAVASALCFVMSMAASWVASFWSGFHRH